MHRYWNLKKKKKNQKHFNEAVCMNAARMITFNQIIAEEIDQNETEVISNDETNSKRRKQVRLG